MLKRNVRSVTALILSFLVLLSSLTVTPFAAQTSGTSSESSVSQTSGSPASSENPDELQGLKDQYAQLEQQQEELKQKSSEVQNDKQKKEIEKQKLQRDIVLIERQLKVLNTQGKLLGEGIEDKKQAIEKKQVDVEDKFELFKKRLRAMYMVGDTSLLEIFLGAQSYTDMLTRTDTVERITEHDNELIESLTSEMEGLTNEKTRLEKDQKDMESNKKEVEKKKTQLAEKKREIVDQISNIEELERQFIDNREQTVRRMKAIRDEVNQKYSEAIGQFELSEEYAGGDLAWPLPGYYTISSPYGSRFGGADFHTGTDITGGGARGKDIVAANSGIVIVVGWMPNGYGNYFQIDHGGGISTLYAHCDEVLVKPGQEVSKGEVVGKVGSTGWSTGPHLHFEVRVNNETTDPMSHFK
ncbi:murein hydrolase activator EnvC family protein [Candidatus Soleaferrea massiliensis]|uniref:murein hydrolase activator EnvC family protein n=1 Tax=Candidatus Soleaferrea massiliensis TaxID=1470354 RepID=UPI0006944C70|nr:M23 family metallopeptidase [Candidatus Soleaferrea massiliensis]